jgi:hypothetical protein
MKADITKKKGVLNTGLDHGELHMHKKQGRGRKDPADTKGQDVVLWC